MSLLYSMREGLAGFRRAPFASAASTSAIIVALALIGVMALLAFHAERVVDYMQQQGGQVEIFLLSPDESAAEPLVRRLRNEPGVASTTFVSQSEAEEIFLEQFGSEGDVFLGESFLPASIQVAFEPNYAHVDSLSPWVEKVETWENVDEVVYNLPLLTRVQNNRRTASIVALVLGVLVMLASMILVANTIRLTIYARRLLIRTMKLVGATDRFVRRPFLFEGLIQGTVAGALSGTLVVGAHLFLLRFVPFLEGWPGENPIYTLAAMILIGMLLGLIGSLFAARRFIKKVHLH